jgi:glycosyltransferase involved in cell wall biosynthesis
MKVVHVCSVPLHPDHPGVAAVRDNWHPGKWVLHLAQAQKAHTGIEPQLVVNVAGSTCDFSAELEGIPVHYLKCPAQYRAKTLFVYETLRQTKKIRELCPDVVHAHGTEEAHLMAAQRSGFPCVVTIQGAFFIINELMPPGRFSRQKLVELTEAWSLKRAKHVIAKSDYVRERLARRFPQLDLHLIPNTFDPALLQVDRTQKQPDTLVYVGTMDRRKGIHVLRAALETINAEFPRLKLWMIGGMGEADYTEHEQAALRKLFGERVTFFGTLPHVETVQKVAGATCLVAPSLEEMFGNQVIEALLGETHCLVSSGTAMAENVKRFGNGTVFGNGNSEDLAEKIRKVLTTKIFPESGAARQRIIEYMNPEKVARKHFEIYQSLVVNKGASL